MKKLFLRRVLEKQIRLTQILINCFPTDIEVSDYLGLRDSLLDAVPKLALGEVPIYRYVHIRFRINDLHKKLAGCHH